MVSAKGMGAWFPAFAGMTLSGYKAINRPSLPRRRESSKDKILKAIRQSFQLQRQSTQKARMQKQFYVYILASQRNGTLYTGVTSDLVKRVYQHRNGEIDGFTKKYDVKRLIYYETHQTAEPAIKREKQIKKWNRQWKLRLIEEDNPDWKDLYGLIV